MKWYPLLHVMHWSLRLPTQVSHNEEHFLQRFLSSRKKPLGHSETHILRQQTVERRENQTMRRFYKKQDVFKAWIRAGEHLLVYFTLPRYPFIPHGGFFPEVKKSPQEHKISPFTHSLSFICRIFCQETHMGWVKHLIHVWKHTLPCICTVSVTPALCLASAHHQCKHMAKVIKTVLDHLITFCL